MENGDTNSLENSFSAGSFCNDEMTPDIFEKVAREVKAREMETFGMIEFEAVDENGKSHSLDVLDSNILNDESEFWDPSPAKSLNLEPTSLALEKNIKNFQETPSY